MKTFRPLYFLLVLLFILVTNKSFCATFTGKVVDYDTNEPVWGYVYLQTAKIGCETNKLGEFQFENIPVGSYKLEVVSSSYITLYDSIDVSVNQRLIEKDYRLQTEIVDYDVKLTKKDSIYFTNLIESSNNKPILEFSIDSLVIDSLTNYSTTIYFHASFTNNSSYPVYILEEKECLRPFTFHIKNADGELMRPNGLSLSCDTRRFYNPDLDDLIELPPHSKIQYPKTVFWLYDFSESTNGIYEVQISYEHVNPLELKSYRSKKESYDVILKDEIEAAKKSLPGSYLSNKISFENEND